MIFLFLYKLLNKGHILYYFRTIYCCVSLHHVARWSSTPFGSLATEEAVISLEGTMYPCPSQHPVTDWSCINRFRDQAINADGMDLEEWMWTL